MSVNILWGHWEDINILGHTVQTTERSTPALSHVSIELLLGEDVTTSLLRSKSALSRVQGDDVYATHVCICTTSSVVGRLAQEKDTIS
jgi:hypothetical protein